MNISFIGLGKLGLCSATCFASKGHNVIGVDNNSQFITSLRSGECPIDEPGLEPLLKNARNHLQFTMDYAEAINGSDVTLIIVPTPSQKDGTFTNKYLETVITQIGPFLRQKKAFHVIDIVSTVMPTTCDQIIKPLLEELSGKKCGSDFGLIYNPEFIALGSVIRDFLNPDMVLIGASDTQSAQTIQSLYASMVDSQPQYAIMSLVNAEITKLSLNCFVTMKISYANELAAVCEQVPEADVDIITSAIGADTRIGKKYLKGGLGFGGPCFPRDNLAFQRFAENRHIHVHLSPSVVKINNSIVDRIENVISATIAPGSIIAMLGLSYKSGTHIIEESQSLMLASNLAKKGYCIRLHDPKALETTKTTFVEAAEYYEDPYKATTGAHCVVLLTDWPQFHSLDWAKIEDNCEGSAPLLFDSWRLLKNHPLEKFQYVALGLGTTRRTK